jgi:nitrite reductase/ring-hydroxylating ferredoxin subunit
MCISLYYTTYIGLLCDQGCPSSPSCSLHFSVDMRAAAAAVSLIAVCIVLSCLAVCGLHLPTMSPHRRIVAGGRGGSSIAALGARRKGSLDKLMEDAESEPSGINSGFWTRVSGVSLPPEGAKKAWELELDGNKVTVAAFRIDSTLYALGNECPRCAFDLWRGTLIRGQPGSGSSRGQKGEPKISCPLCGTTYDLATGQAGEPMKRSGISGWVGGLTLGATSEADAKKGATVVPLKVEKRDEVFLDLRNLASGLQT